MDKVWATHVHVHHGDPTALVDVLSLDDVDQLLTSGGIRTPALRVAKDGAVLPAGSFTRTASLGGQPLPGLVDVRKLLDLIDDGATAVLQGLHRYWPPLARLVRDLEVSLGHSCQANAYLTPPASQGFAVHSDTHDVFVFQTHGRKRWEIHDESGVRPVLLEPGTSMYLPTGTPHAARAQDTMSLHVTIGIHRTTWREVLLRVTESTLEKFPYDDVVPAGYLSDPADFSRRLDRHLDALKRRLEQASPDLAVAEEAARFLRNRTPVLDGALRDRVELPQISDDTVLERRASSVCRVVADRDRLRVLLGDREVQMPARLGEPMRYLAARNRLCPAELSPWLDAQSRLVLARRLVREGLLRVLV